MKQNIFKRNKDVLWRINDDGTALVLSGTNGNAYLLSPSVVSIWMALEHGITQTDLVDSALTDDEGFIARMDGLLEKGLIVSEDTNNSRLLTEPVPMSQATTCQKVVLSTIQGPYGIDEIAFGGCDCVDNTGNRNGKRAVGCAAAGTAKENVSVV
jgi:hypothetical protein